MQNFCNEAKVRGPISPPDPLALAEQAIKAAIYHLSAFQPVFRRQDILKSASFLSLLNHSPTLLEQCLEQQLQSAELLYLGNQLCTTQAARDLEIENVASARLNKKQVHPLFTRLATKFVLYQSGLENAEHKEALAFLLRTPDRQVAIQYGAKANQQTLIRAYLEAIRSHRLYPVGLTQDPMRVEPFKETLGLERAHTLEGFLLSCASRLEEIQFQKRNPGQVPEPQTISAKRSPHFGKIKTPSRPKSVAQLRDAREIWILDCESPVSLLQVRQLQDYATQLGARLIWAEHAFKKQSAIFSLIKHGLSHFEFKREAKSHLSEPLKQRVVANLFLEQDKKNQVTVIVDLQTRQAAAVAHSIALGEDSTLISLSGAESKALNLQVRVAKNRKGELKGPESAFEILSPLGLSAIQRSKVKFYQLNDVIRFTAENAELKIQKNNYWTVTDIEFQGNRLSVKDQNDQTRVLNLNLNLSKILQVYRPESRALQINDRILWTQTLRHPEDKAQDRLKNEWAWVRSVNFDSIEVQLRNGQITTLQSNALADKHWDYAYALNLEQGSKGDGRDKVLVLSSTFPFINYHALGKILSENSNKLHIFCDDSLGMVEALLRQSTKEILALDNRVAAYNKASEQVPLLDDLRSFFPQLTSRMDGLYARHQSLLKEVEQAFGLEQHTQSPNLAIEASTEGAIPAQNSDQNVERHNLHHETQRRAACQAIDWLSTKYGERDAVFKGTAFKKELLQLNSLTTPPDVLMQELNFAYNQGLLVEVERGGCDENGKEQSSLIATRETILLERACIFLAERGRNQLQPILTVAAETLPAIQNENLTQGQQKAIALLLTTSDRVLGIQGVAGAGKTTMLRTLNKYCRQSGVEILGLSNSTGARQQLAEGSADINSPDFEQKTGIQTLTTRKFLMNCEKLAKKDPHLAQTEYGNKLILLDESSFASTRDMFALLHWAEKFNVRLILMGDYKQLNSVEAGRIFYALLGSKIAVWAMTENVRFSELKALKTMQHIYKNEIKAALNNLGNSVIEIADREQRLNYIANLYLEQESQLRNDTLVITPLNKDRRFVNAAIHQGLKKQGVLSGEEFEVNTLRPVNMTQAEKEKIYFFKPGFVIRFNRNAMGVPIQAGEYCKVLGSRSSDQILLLERSDHSRVFWSPDRHMAKEQGALEVYQPERRAVMSSETIRWLRNDEARGIRNGETAVLVSLHQDTDKVMPFMTVRLKNGLEQTLDLEQRSDQHWDYAYATTTFVAQGADKPRTIAHGRGGNLYLLKKPYPGDLLLYTENSDQESKASPAPSRWVTVVSVADGGFGDQQKVQVRDREGRVFKIDNLNEWQCYQNPRKRKTQYLPRETSPENFLVTVTRGDKVTLVVDNREAYEHALVSKGDQKRSVQEYLDPERDKVRAKVQKLTENVSGRAELKSDAIKASKVNQKAEPSESSVPRNRRSVHRQEVFFVDQQEIIDCLHSDILRYASAWLGTPKRRNAREARWEGALSVVLSGPKAGMWKSWSSGEGGKDLLSLYLKHHDLEYKQGLKELAHQLGIKSILEPLALETSKIKAEQKRIKLDLKMKVEAQKAEVAIAARTQDALKIYNKALPLKDTLGEKYLRVYRGIEGVLPEDFRFCPRLKHRDLQQMRPALIAPIRNRQGEIQAIVRIFLDQEGRKLKATYKDLLGESRKAADKLNLGSMENAGVVINPGKNAATVYIAEGIETALSAASALKDARVLASLSVSHLKNVPLSADTQKVVLCADEDGADARSNKSLVEAANIFLSRGLKVEIAYPSKVANLLKTDFNDVLKMSGLKAVEQDLGRTIRVREPLTEQALQQLKTEPAHKDFSRKPPNPNVKELEP